MTQLACGVFRHGSFKTPADLPELDELMTNLDKFCFKDTDAPVPQDIARDQLARLIQNKNLTWKMNPIPPHASAADIEQWIEEDCIWGCGQPFRIVNSKPEICDFI